MDLVQALGLALLAVVAGFIDAIAGGGALVNLPALAAVLGPGALAVGTNKVVGATAALTALVVLLRRGQRLDRTAFLFGAWVAVGSLAGSSFAPAIDPRVFRWLLLGVCPLVLVLVWQKDRWIAAADRVHSPEGPRPSLFAPALALSGLAVGFYDGLFGPAGGTFMFLALVFAVRLPLLGALVAAKLVNAGSALVSLANYARQDLVVWPLGLVMAAGVLAGAALGAHQASRAGARIVRPMLAVVTLLLLARLALTDV